MLCNFFGSGEKTYDKPQTELSISCPRYEWCFIVRAGKFNTINTRYVYLPRAKSSVCWRSGVQLNVAKASTKRDFFFFYRLESRENDRLLIRFLSLPNSALFPTINYNW